MDATLRIIRGPRSGETIQMPRGKLVIGRETDCQLRLDGKSVSAHHCVLLLDEYTLRIRDLGSTSGTRVNGNRIGKHESILLNDDTVSIDNLTFQIDLTEATEDAVVTRSEAQPAAPSSELDETGIFDGDTDPVVPTEVPPVNAEAPSSPEPHSQNESTATKGASTAGDRMSLSIPASMAAEKRVPTSAPPPLSSPQRTTPRPSPKKVAKPIGKPHGKTAVKIEGGAKAASSTSLRRALPIAGLIGLVGLVAGGAFFLRGSGQATPYAAPQTYAAFSPKSFAMALSCEVPAEWKQRFRGGKNVGPMWARFSDGGLSIEISEDLSGGAIREAVVAMRKKADPARRDAAPVEQIHEYLREKVSENFKSYHESPRAQALKTKAYGEARISDFTATEGIFSTEIRGCRATALNQAHQLTVMCKCPPSEFDDAKPVFEKVIASLSFEAAAEAK